MSYNNAGNLYYNLHDYAKAEKFYLKAIAIYQTLADKNPEGFNPELAASHNSTGVLYVRLHNYAKAIEYFQKAAVMYEKLCANAPDIYSESLEKIYTILLFLHQELAEEE